VIVNQSINPGLFVISNGF